MRGKQTHFFATRKDLINVIQICERSRELKYVMLTMYDSPDLTIFYSLSDWDSLGLNPAGRTGQDNFLVFDRNEDIEIRTIPQRKGGVKYAVGHTQESSSIVLRPSGMHYQTSLVAGNIGTISTHSTSIEIYNLFRKSILQNSKKVGYAYVCTDAVEFMKNGGRMVTMGIDSPPEYDLKFQSS